LSDDMISVYGNAPFVDRRRRICMRNGAETASKIPAPILSTERSMAQHTRRLV